MRLDMLGRAVRAGHAFTSALELIAQESPEPIAGEFAITFEEQNYGIPIRDALEHLAERVPLLDVRFLVTALIIQKDSGGNLAEILDQLSRVIRERFRIYRDVKTKTALGRLTAGILIMLPFAMLGLMMSVAHDYEAVLFQRSDRSHTPGARGALAIGWRHTSLANRDDRGLERTRGNALCRIYHLPVGRRRSDGPGLRVQSADRGYWPPAVADVEACRRGRRRGCVSFGRTRGGKCFCRHRKNLPATEREKDVPGPASRNSSRISQRKCGDWQSEARGCFLSSLLLVVVIWTGLD